MKVKLQKYIEKYGDGIHGTPCYDENGEYYFVNGNNLENGKVNINDDTLRITKKEYEKIKRPLTPNTILLSINGSLGKIAIYNDEKIVNQIKNILLIFIFYNTKRIKLIIFI